MIEDAERYQKNHDAISLDDQQTLADSHVAIIGFGGLGERVAELLCRIGVGNLTIVDFDHFAPSNINRQLFCHEKNIGSCKVGVGKTVLERINSNVNVRAIEGSVTEKNIQTILDGCDCVADCLDNASARLLVAEGARKHRLPLVHAAIAGWSGRVAVAFPDSGIMEALCSTESGAIKESGRGVETICGNLSFTASVAASIQAAEVTKVLLGILKEDGENNLIEFDLLASEFEKINLGNC